MLSALDDLKVLDLSQGMAAPFAARLLADFGADVVKVEPPEGDRVRRMPPFAPGGDSLTFTLVNLNKRGITLDLDTPEGQANLRALAAGADVIIENFAPGYLAARGLDHAALSALNPKLVMTSITPFGQTGPYRDYLGAEIVTYATSGIMSISGTSDREPLKHGGFPAQYQCGLNGFIGTMAALLVRDSSGLGQHVDISMQEVITSSLAVTQPWYSFSGGVQGRRKPSGSSFEQVTPCKDGYFIIQQGGGSVAWDTIADFFDSKEMKAPRFADPATRPANGAELDRLITQASKDRTMNEMFRTASEAYKLLIGIVQTPADLLACPQLAARDYFATVEQPGIGTLNVPFRLFGMSETGMTLRHPAPGLGEHQEVLDALPAYPAAGVAPAPGIDELPLKGIRILDISNVFSLPYATALLCDLGAEVIKIEGPSRIDVSRGAAYGVFAENDPGEDSWNRNSTFNTLNRGKKSLCIDLRSGEGQAALRDLIAVSDVIAENFTPRVMKGWGLDYPNLSKLNPAIIMASCSGYGGNGPYSTYPAQATTQEATHGLAHVTGYAGGPPSKAGQSFVDFLAAWSLVAGILTALRHRRRTGRGQWVDVAMYQAGCTVIGEKLLDSQVNGATVERIGNRHPWQAPQGVYPCTGEDQWCAVTVQSDAEWRALCRVIGRSDLADDPGFGTAPARMTRHDEIDELLSGWTAGRSKAEAMVELQAAGVRAGAVLDAADLHTDPHLAQRGLLEQLSFPTERGIGPKLVLGRPWKFSRLAPAVCGPGPALGADNVDILRELLGYHPSRIASLEADGIIADRPKVQRAVWSLPLEERVENGFLARYEPNYQARIAKHHRDAPQPRAAHNG
ncbi:MAG: hypothetical protein ABS76_07585 [Pelagibacterium sp. SCN 64-44]|nr:MAG: hypothetical protein ABS76_07585 [Pelagibacterium sp. SCN 64-44]